MSKVRVVIVEDNDTFRETLELLFGLREEIDVVGSVATGNEAPPVVRELRPDVVLMDYRMPGLNGAEATRLVLEADPATRVVCLSASVTAQEIEEVDAGGGGGRRHEGRELRSARGDRRARLPGSEARRGEHRGRPRLDCRLPGRAARFPNFRIVPLYVRFGDESFRDYVDITADRFYERLQTDPELPTTSQPTPGDFLATYEELAGQYERILSIQIASTLSGTFASAQSAAEMLGGDAVRVIDSRTVSAALAMLGIGVQRRLERGTTDEEIDAFIAHYQREHQLLFTVNTLDYLARGGRIGRAAAFAGNLLNVKPILTISRRRGDPAQARAWQREGVRRVPDAVRVDLDGLAEPQGRDRPRRRSRTARGPAGARRARSAARRDRDGDVARPGRRHARRPGHGRLLLVRRLLRIGEIAETAGDRAATMRAWMCCSSKTTTRSRSRSPTGLRREGFDVVRAATGEEALAAAPPDIVLLDLRLPDMDGLEVCRELRARSAVPIIVVSARGEEVDRVIGLELGADDYVVKPFGIRELVARIRAVARRSAAPRTSRSEIDAGRISIDLRGHRAMVDGSEVQLTGREFDLLTVLARNAGAVVDRERILREVWHTTWYGSSKTVDVHVAALRRKLGDPGLIETVRGDRPPPGRVTWRLLASYLALTIVVLIALEVPLAIVYDRNERRI